MARKAKPPLTLKVVQRADRGKWVYRWQDHAGDWHQVNSDVEVGGPSEKARLQSRNAAERAAAAYEAKLREEYAAREAEAAAAKAREADNWDAQIDGFVSKIRAGGAGAEYVAQVDSRLRRFAAEAVVLDPDTHQLRPLRSVREITEDVVVGFLNQLMARQPTRKPKPPRTERQRKNDKNKEPKPEPPPQVPRPASVETKNQHLTSIKSFCAYLTDRRVFDRSPAAKLKRPSAEVDRRRERRVLTPDEFARLIVAAQRGGVVATMSGPDRAMMYIVSSWTGYRRKELASLTLRHFQLDEAQPVLRVKAPDSKHRKLDKIPLHLKLVEALKAWVASKGLVSLDAPVFDLIAPGGGLRDTAQMMRHDLAAAGLEYRDSEGLYADFHSNRAAFITNMIDSGVPFFRVVELARHSDPRLTKRYDKSTVAQLADDVHRLPEPPRLDGKKPDPPPAA